MAVTRRHSSTIADHMTETGHRIKWDHFDILATGQYTLDGLYLEGGGVYHRIICCCCCLHVDGPVCGVFTTEGCC